MQISGLSAGAASKVMTASQSVAPAAAPVAGSGVEFKGVVDRIREAVGKQDLLGVNLHKELSAVSHTLQSGKSFNARELLLYQIKVGQLGMRVEFVSKIADGGLQTVRKLQQG